MQLALLVDSAAAAADVDAAAIAVVRLLGHFAGGARSNPQPTGEMVPVRTAGDEDSREGREGFHWYTQTP